VEISKSGKCLWTSQPETASLHRGPEAETVKVTGQGSETAGASVTIDSALVSTGIVAKKPEPQAQEALHGKPNPFPARQEASSGLVFCIVCGRSALLPAPMPRSP
jgi:hypothetical protein